VNNTSNNLVNIDTNNWWYGYNPSFGFQYQSAFGTLSTELQGIYFAYQLVPQNNPGPTQQAYQNALNMVWSTVEPNSTIVYSWADYDGNVTIQNGTCCIPDSMQLTVSPTNSSLLIAQLTFGSSVTSNLWCTLENIQPGTLNLTAQVDIVATYATLWDSDLAPVFGNSYSFEFVVANMTVLVTYTVHQQDLAGTCGFNMIMSSEVENNNVFLGL